MSLYLFSEGLSILLSHLKAHDEAVVGNAALCLSHLTKDTAELEGKDSDSKQVNFEKKNTGFAPLHLLQLKANP